MKEKKNGGCEQKTGKIRRYGGKQVSGKALSKLKKKMVHQKTTAGMNEGGVVCPLSYTNTT